MRDLVIVTQLRKSVSPGDTVVDQVDYKGKGNVSPVAAALDYIEKNKVDVLFLEANLGSPGAQVIPFGSDFFSSRPHIQFILVTGTDLDHVLYQKAGINETLPNVILDLVGAATITVDRINNVVKKVYGRVG
jgi:two-component SAPR family response regulator